MHDITVKKIVNAVTVRENSRGTRDMSAWIHEKKKKKEERKESKRRVYK